MHMKKMCTRMRTSALASAVHSQALRVYMWLHECDSVECKCVCVCVRVYVPCALASAVLANHIVGLDATLISAANILCGTEEKRKK